METFLLILGGAAIGAIVVFAILVVAFANGMKR